MATTFVPAQHGFHFPNAFTNPVIGGISTKGLCGGMAYCALDYYFANRAIPTHQNGDFPAPNTECPETGQLHAMIYSRLLDSLRDNFGKWLCVYPNLLDVLGGFLGLYAGPAGLIWGAVAGALAGGVYEIVACPGGLAQMTAQELPKLTASIDAGKPVSISLVAPGDITNLGNSHQVVAYGYEHGVDGGGTVIQIYDNNYPNTESTLTVTVANEAIDESTGDQWAALFVNEGYNPQTPSYFDLGLAAPESVVMTGPVKVITTSVGPIAVAPGGGGPVKPVIIPPKTVKVPIQEQSVNAPLTLQFTILNFGEWPAHYASLGVETTGPTGDNIAPISGPNNLAVGASQAANNAFPNFTTIAGQYTLGAGFTTVEGFWTPFPGGPMSITVVD